VASALRLASRLAVEHWLRISDDSHEKEAVLFWKKEPKNFYVLGVRCRIEPRQRHKSLLLLFFRKEVLPSYPAAFLTCACQSCRTSRNVIANGMAGFQLVASMILRASPQA
jgi:hypothetical protein